MTVKQLIEALQEVKDQDLPVYVYDDSQSINDVGWVEVLSIEDMSLLGPKRVDINV